MFTATKSPTADTGSHLQHLARVTRAGAGVLALLLAAPVVAATTAQTPSMLDAVASQVAAGTNHGCAVLAGGAVECWGWNLTGQLGDGTTDDHPAPVAVHDLGADVIAVAAGMYHTCALTATGTVECWGRNVLGQLGDGSNNDSHTPTQVRYLNDAVAITAGLRHSCALTSAGVVVCWGDNDHGQLGDGLPDNANQIVAVLGLSADARSIAAGSYFTCALLVNGKVNCWGENNHGQLGDGTLTDRGAPVRVKRLTGSIVAIAAGGDHACALTAAGGVECWGGNAHGELGDQSQTDRHTAVAVHDLASGVTAIAAGDADTCALTTSAAVECWGDGSDGQLGNHAVADSNVPVPVDDLPHTISALAAGAAHTCALSTTGGLYCWGSNALGQLGDDTTLNRDAPVPVLGFSVGVSDVAAGDRHTCALLPTGEVKCWGGNAKHQLGDGDNTQSLTPLMVSGLDHGVRAITAGYYHSCALGDTGTVSCWGWNQFGQLGDGNNDPTTVPVAVPSLTYYGVAAITAGNAHTCALTAWNGVECWGSNGSGQLGDNTNHDHGTPASVLGLGGGVVGMAAGKEHSCALTQTDVVKCWGGDDDGQLGDGNSGNGNDRLLPFAVNGLGSGLIEIGAGSNFTCALAAAGSVQCWGSNAAHELGNAVPGGSATPVAVNVIHDAAALTVGEHHACVRLASGQARCWGQSDSGQLGDASTSPQTNPVGVHRLSDVAVIRAGGAHTCAVSNVGRLACWGSNQFGQLGNNATQNQLEPVDIRAGQAIHAALPSVIGFAPLKLSPLVSGGVGVFTITSWTPSACIVQSSVLLPGSAILIPQADNHLCGVRISQAGGSDGQGGTLAPAPDRVFVIPIQETIFHDGFDGSGGAGLP